MLVQCTEVHCRIYRFFFFFGTRGFVWGEAECVKLASGEEPRESRDIGVPNLLGALQAFIDELRSVHGLIDALRR